MCASKFDFPAIESRKAGRRQDSPAPFDCAQGRLRETGIPVRRFWANWGGGVLGRLYLKTLSPFRGGTPRMSTCSVVSLASRLNARCTTNFDIPAIESRKAGRRQDSPAPFDCAQGRLRETGSPVRRFWANWGGGVLGWLCLKTRAPLGAAHGDVKRTRLSCSSRHPLPHFSKNISRLVSPVISGHNETARALAP